MTGSEQSPDQNIGGQPDHYPAPGAPPPGLPPTHQVGSAWGWGQGHDPQSSPVPPPSPPPPPPGAYPSVPAGGSAWGNPPSGAPGRGLPGGVPVGAYLAAAHKPGAIPLRPLNLGDIYDAAFKIIRYNPKATVGAAVLVAAVSMAIPVLLTAGLSFAVDMTLDPEAGGFQMRDTVGFASSIGSLLLGTVLQSLGLILVTGMIAKVVALAAIGRKVTLGEAWAATAGKRWRLLGLALLLGALTTLVLVIYVLAWVVVAQVAPTWAIVTWGVVTIPAFLAFMCWFWVRVYYLPVAPLMLEEGGILSAVQRGYRLTAGAFWRTFGIALLTMIIAQIAAGMLSAPLSFMVQLGGLAGAGAQYYLLVVVISQALSTVITTAFVAPFTAGVTALQYLDLRIRKEAYDVELMNQAGITRA